MACGGQQIKLADLMKKRKGIIGFQIGAAALFIIHYILLGAYTGAALNLIGMLRSIVFINNDEKWAKSPVWLGVFVVIFNFFINIPQN